MARASSAKATRSRSRCRFRGREMAHQHLGMALLTRIQKDTETFAKLEQYPKMEGRQMMMVLAPR